MCPSITHSHSNCRRSALAAIALLACAGAGAQEDLSEVEIETVPVATGVYMLLGRGGNIGLCVGSEGAFIIDDQFAPLTGRILAAVAAVTDQPVRFVVNTHFHGDHTGGNENLGEAGAIIVAHDNVRERLSTEQFNAVFNRRTPPQPKGALPVITFAAGLTFHWNDEEIEVFHVPSAHTDGDVIIHFKRANVLHTGDVAASGQYPFIDTGAGGSMKGMIAAVDQILARADDKTRIIPGHGAITDRAAMQAYRDMLATVHERISALIAQGKTRDEVIAARPAREFDAEWGQGFMQPDVWAGIAYDGVKASP